MKEKHAMHAVNGQKRPAYFNLFEVLALLLALLLLIAILILLRRRGANQDQEKK